MRHWRTSSWAVLAWLLMSAAPGLVIADGAVAGEAKAAAPAPARPDYPVPPASERRLFYLQRSSNANTVVYDARLLAPGQLDPKRPVDVYWLRYNTSGERKSLNFAERSFAYGVDATPVNDALGGFRVRIVAMEERPFRVFVDQDGKAQAIMKLAGRPARLRSVYLQLADGGLLPDVRYIDVFGTELATGRPLHERIVP